MEQLLYIYPKINNTYYIYINRVEETKTKENRKNARKGKKTNKKNKKKHVYWALLWVIVCLSFSQSCMQAAKVLLTYISS